MALVLSRAILALPYGLGPHWAQMLWSLMLFWIAYTILLVIYRITLHPLANFPGPKLAGASYCYEFWYNVVRGGRYTREIKRLHAHYGPIIRINPDELHCNDLAFANTIYATGNRKRNKSKYYLATGPGTADHSLHRFRSSVVNKFFSRSQILRLESLIQVKAQRLCDKLLAHRGSGPLIAANAFGCFTSDVLTEYCFGKSTDFLNQDGWERNYNAPFDSLFRMTHILRHFPWLTTLMDSIPLCAVDIPRQIQAVRHHPDNSPQGHPTVFSMLLNSDLPSKEKSVKRLSGEAQAILLGGISTTTSVLCLLTYYLLANPLIYSRLRNELEEIKPDDGSLPSWVTLEGLPYFNAVIHEGLRLTYGAPGRLPRVATEEDLVYEGLWESPTRSSCARVAHIIPRGYAIGMSAYIMHSDESIFPEAARFLPERWLNGEGGKEPHHHLFSFSKGSRKCMGMQLAYAELYICLAALTIRVIPHMRLYQTRLSDIDYDYDEVAPRPRRGSKGLRILMVEGEHD
ncbi:hypothetical protein HIM_02938 [Hirsutella minnesotensis 3608]|nr:hypothetical protein HIM_02938 [Hirsutella minnesotensis 3608]